MLKTLLSYSVSSFFFGLFGVNWDAIDRRIEREFPNVSTVSTSSLHQQLQQPASLPVIIDVREAEEYSVSHLQTALNIMTGEDVARQVPDRDTPIIVYCSVGYRSAGVAAKLEELGYTRVSNLRHSIFEWASKGYPMESGAGDTDKVHPFNTAWGSLVDQELRAYSPD